MNSTTDTAKPTSEHHTHQTQSPATAAQHKHASNNKSYTDTINPLRQPITTFQHRQQWPHINGRPTTLSLASFNAQGAFSRNSGWIDNLIQEFSIDLLLVQEINGKAANHRHTVRNSFQHDADDPAWESFWSTSINGHSNGVGIIMKGDIARFKGSTTLYKDRAISVILILPRNAKLRITNIYWPANNADSQERKKLKEWINNLIQSDDNNTEQIIGGDWNTALDPQLDRLPPRQQQDASKECIQDIIHSNELHDIYRVLNPTKTQMTHITIHNQEIVNASRIDYFLTTAHIRDRTLQTDTFVGNDAPSDHRPTFMEIRWDNCLPSTRRQAPRRIPDLAKATDEDKNDYIQAMTTDSKTIAHKLQQTIQNIGTPSIGYIGDHQDQADRLGITDPAWDEQFWSKQQNTELRNAADKALRRLNEAIIRNATSWLPQKIMGSGQHKSKELSSIEKLKRGVGKLRQLLHDDSPWDNIIDTWTSQANTLYQHCTQHEIYFPDPHSFPIHTTTKENDTSSIAANITTPTHTHINPLPLPPPHAHDHDCRLDLSDTATQATATPVIPITTARVHPTTQHDSYHTHTSSISNSNMQLPPQQTKHMLSIWYQQLGKLYRTIDKQAHALHLSESSTAIEKAVTSRNQNFTDNLKKCLDT